MRFWGTSWMNLPPDEALDFFDKNGVVVRRSGMLDGEAIGYMAIENDADLKKKYSSDIKMDLMENWRDQVVAQVKGERNHPSVMIWSIENEWLYINCINLYGGLMDQFEDETVKTAAAVMQADPTRPSMTDGGGATKIEPDAGPRRPLHHGPVSRVSRAGLRRRTPRAAAGAAGSGTNSGRASSARSCSPPATTRPSPTSAARRFSSASNPAAAPSAWPCAC